MKGTFRSAFIKGGTLAHLVSVFPDSPEVKRIISNQVTKVKFEVDVNPALGATYEEKLEAFPSLHYYGLRWPSLFAGKAHALICRAWKNRVKGRDLYDYLFYIEKEIPLNLSYLKNKLVQSGRIQESDPFGKEEALSLLRNAFPRSILLKLQRMSSRFFSTKKMLPIGILNYFLIPFLFSNSETEGCHRTADLFIEFVG
jgi:hypothetical protein